LDYIRTANVVDGEAGGITQKVSAYEVERPNRRITFLDTPGHEAFGAIRSRGASVADIAVLVVSAEDGVRPQTLEAITAIKNANIPFIVAINKIDKDGANPEAAKTSLAEAGVYVEGFGGDVPWVGTSGKTGQGVPELLDMIELVADVAGLTGNPEASATGIVIEAHIDRKKGLAATLIIKDGTLKSGQALVAGSAIAPVRIMENFLGKPIASATFSSPIRIIGWSALPPAGVPFASFPSKKEAENYLQTSLKERVVTKSAAQSTKQSDSKKPIGEPASDEKLPEIATLPLIIKAADIGGLEAVKHELAKINHDRLTLKIIGESIGEISENDIKTAVSDTRAIILGFGVGVAGSAKSLAETSGVNIQTFDIIYKLSEWLTEEAAKRVPKMQVEETIALAKILKIFSRTKDKQIIGGRVEKGTLANGAEVKILRRDFEIGQGRIRELQRQKNRVNEVPEGQEFGVMVESKIDIAPGDRLEVFHIVEK
jgi:translation initiation factor IF-2